MSVFIDTSALLALLDDEDLGHAASRRAWVGGIDTGEGFVTSNYVVLESCAVAQRRYGIEAVRALVDELLPLVHIERVTEQDHEVGQTALLTAGRRRLSLVDCVSFAMMRRRGIRRYLAIDRHFAEQGFEPYAPADSGD